MTTRRSLRRAVYCLVMMMVAAFATAAFPMTGQAHAAQQGSPACSFEVVDVNGDWKYTAQNGVEPVCNSGDYFQVEGTDKTIYGLGVTMKVPNRHVYYRVHFNGDPANQWSLEKGDGDKLSDPGFPPKPVDGIRIQIAPLGEQHICYDVIDNAGTVYRNVCDGRPAGNLTNPLTAIRIRYTR